MDNSVAVVGGAGPTGRLVVSLLQEQPADERPAEVRVLSRNPHHAREVLPDGVAVYHGDVREHFTLRELVRGISGLIVVIEPGQTDAGPDSPEATMYLGVRNLLADCQSGPGAPRVVLASQLYMTHKNHPRDETGNLHEWGLRGEESVRESGLPYTIVRPGLLTHEPGGTRGIRLEQGSDGQGSVSRADAARVCVQSLRSPSAAGTTFAVYNEDGMPPENWEKLFSSLSRD